MSDKCEHGELLDAMTCGECVIEECESLKVENERLKDVAEDRASAIAQLTTTSDTLRDRAEKAEREREGLADAFLKDEAELTRLREIEKALNWLTDVAAKHGVLTFTPNNYSGFFIYAYDQHDDRKLCAWAPATESYGAAIGRAIKGQDPESEMLEWFRGRKKRRTTLAAKGGE